MADNGNGNGNEKRWTHLLDEAVTVPGLIHECYRSFHGYSIGNQLLALLQCHERDIVPGPIATYKAWQAKGRQVQRGEKALELWMPVTIKAKSADDDGNEVVETKTIFRLLPRWFVYSQTEGDELPPNGKVGAWDFAAALAALDIQQVAFDLTNGNPQGFARDRSIAINPLAVNSIKTGLHEIAHVFLGHTGNGLLVDGERLARSIVEVEAEGTALIVCDALGLEGQDYSRGYIQSWLGAGETIPEQSARRIFGAADAILKAGREKEDDRVV